MDGHFVPNLTFGAPVIQCLRKHTKAVLDVHLMVSDPRKWVPDMAAAGGRYARPTSAARVTCAWF